MVLFDWKSIFVVFLIILVVWYLFFSDNGSDLLSTLKSGAGEIANILPDSDVFISGDMETGNTTMYLSVQASAFNGKEFSVKDSNLDGVGSCNLSIGDLTVEQKNQTLQEISIGIIEGKISLTNEKNFSIQGVSSGLEMGNNIIPADEKGFGLSIECVSTDFTLTNILEKKIVLDNVSGSVIGDIGTLTLTDHNIEIDSFKGSMQVSGNMTMLNGTIVKILLNGEKAII